jgi:hypothetical protein
VLKGVPVSGTAIFGASAEALLRSAAEQGARGRAFGAFPVFLADQVWEHLRDEMEAKRAWSVSNTEALIVTVGELGSLWCWPRSAEMSGCRIGWGTTGNPDGPTREGKR